VYKNNLALIIFLYLTTANAGFFIDPHVGMKILGSTKLAGKKFDHSQLEFGSKMGWHTGNTQLGLDLNLLYPTYKSTAADGAIESYSGFQYGLFLGGRYEWFRAWGTWVIASTQTSDINNEVYKGSGWELGFGLGPQNFINLFLKVQLLQFKTLEDSVGTKIDLAGGRELETQAFIIGFDIPFNFSGGK